MFKVGDVVKYKRGFALYEVKRLCSPFREEGPTHVLMRIIQRRNGEMSEARNEYFAKIRLLEHASIDDDNLWE